MLNLNDRQRNDIGRDIVGVVLGTDHKFRHVECFATIDELKDALSNEETNVLILRTDDWLLDAGQCVVCGALADEDAHDAPHDEETP